MDVDYIGNGKGKDKSKASKSFLLIDSGSEIHVCPPSFCAKCPWTDHRNVVVRTAGGHIIRHYGENPVHLKTHKGFPLTVNFHVADVRRPIVSVKRFVERGYTIEFSPNKGCIRSVKGAEKPLSVAGGTYVASDDDKVPGEMWVAAKNVMPEEMTSGSFGAGVSAPLYIKAWV
eukprot:3973072-Amphidinium_carterae.1